MTNPRFTHEDYEIVKRDIVYQGFFRVCRYSLKYRLFEGGWTDIIQREIIERHAAVAILPYDPVLDKVILIEQFRAASISDPKSPWLIEIPAGLFEEGEKPATVAIRETKEETGAEIVELVPISEYFPTPGSSNEYNFIYCGKINAEKVEGIHGLPQENENIRVMNMSADDAFEKLYAGEIKSGPAWIALLWLQLHRRRLQEVW